MKHQNLGLSGDVWWTVRDDTSGSSFQSGSTRSRILSGGGGVGGDVDGGFKV